MKNKIVSIITILVLLIAVVITIKITIIKIPFSKVQALLFLNHKITAINTIQIKSTLVSAKNVIFSINPFKLGTMWTNPSKKLSKALIQPKCKIIEMARIKLMGKPQYIAFEYLFIFTPVFNNVFSYFTTYLKSSPQSVIN